MTATTPLLRGPRQARERLDKAIPPILRPVVRAYILGYASAVAPRVLTLILQYGVRWRKGRGRKKDAQPEQHSFAASLRHVLRSGLDPQRFPTFCATLVGGTTLFNVLVLRLINRLQTKLSAVARRRLSIWISSFIAGWLSLWLLQSKKTRAYAAETTSNTESNEKETVWYAGRTLDLTLFAATRAVDVVVGELWSQRRQRRVAAGRRSWVSAPYLVHGLSTSLTYIAGLFHIKRGGPVNLRSLLRLDNVGLVLRALGAPPILQQMDLVSRLR
ncbi:hypothetical protein NPX13_g8744 [Xylaria arbuscula]|uniref:Uncharacterized protein n=1 Tax=Xylaria arbuscula TaxID=114810 RepID=A0A9W8N8B8_9PEZI|nr:hypothetical protein NPX13_g8744 [Xylaria arbuscula]